MRGSPIVLAAWSAVLACGAARADGDTPGQSGWTELFPLAPPGYAVGLDPPVIAGGDSPAVYRQTARYNWTGNDFRQATATLARDPAFKTKYAVEAFKKEGAIEVVVGKKSGWLRSGGRELVVPISEDKALILSDVMHFGQEEMVRLAGLFHPARVEAALAKPPTEPAKDKPK